MSVPIERAGPKRQPEVRGVKEWLWLWLGGCVVNRLKPEAVAPPAHSNAGTIRTGKFIPIEFGRLGQAVNVPIRLPEPGREADAQSCDQVAESAGQSPPASTRPLTAVTAKAPRTNLQSHWPSASRSTEE
jgi:hypothetical protein